MIFINSSLTCTEKIDVNSSFAVCTVHTARHSLIYETSNGTNGLNDILVNYILRIIFNLVIVIILTSLHRNADSVFLENIPITT